MSNTEATIKEPIGPLNFIIIMMGILVVAFFAGSSVYYMNKGHMPSYYLSTKSLVSNFSIVNNMMNFKLDKYPAEFTLEFKEPPNINPNDKLEVEYTKHSIQLYINDKLAYDKNSDLTFSEIEHYKDKTIITVTKNIKEDPNTVQKSP